MTKQETFDIVARHLLTQNAKSTRAYSNLFAKEFCALRGKEGRKCAVGILVPDSKYKASMEGPSIYADPLLGILREEGHDLLLCDALQKVHDFNRPDDWPAALCKVALQFSLSDRVVTSVRIDKVCHTFRKSRHSSGWLWESPIMTHPTTHTTVVM